MGAILAFVAALGMALGMSKGCTIFRGAGDDYVVGTPREHERYKRDITTNCGPEDVAPPNRVDTTARLADLRAQMANLALDAYIVPLDEEGRRSWVSGFSGSNGDAIVTMDQAACWTDGRYFLQGSQQLDCNWELMRMGQPGVPDYAGWLTGDANLAEGSLVGADPRLIGAETWLTMKQRLKDEKDIDLVAISENLVDAVWTEEDGRPVFVARDIVVHAMEYAGKAFEDKVDDLRKALVDGGHKAMIVTENDEIAWLFNMRGEGSSSVGGLFHSPFFQSVALVTADSLKLWIHTEKITQSVSDHLNAPFCDVILTCVETAEYADATADLAAWAAASLAPTDTVLIPSPSQFLSGSSYAIYQSIPEANAKIADSPLVYPKAEKNAVEAEGMVQAHIRDAYACCEFYAFMHDQVEIRDHDDWTEMAAQDYLTMLRSKQDKARGDSFGTISASGANGAVIHYSATPETNAKINRSAVYLVDSGGQYLDGTTDVTRTFYYGDSPDAGVVEMYTRVLMGVIDLASAVVPLDTGDTAVDLATRRHLFEIGKDYRHGTGHGIGAYGGVHENPLSVRLRGSEGRFRPNMFFSDEPGYYEDGAYGIRLETIMRVVPKNYSDDTYGEFVGFEAVTLVPFEPKLIDFSLMSVKQIEWYNAYHAKIRSVVLPHFADNGDDLTRDWILDKTAPVSPDRSGDVARFLVKDTEGEEVNGSEL